MGQGIVADLKFFRFFRRDRSKKSKFGGEDDQSLDWSGEKLQSFCFETSWGLNKEKRS